MRSIKKLTLVFNEIYTGVSHVVLEMTDEQFEEYTNSKVSLDELIKRSESTKDFLDRTKEHPNPGYKVVGFTPIETIKPNAILTHFDVEVIL